MTDENEDVYKIRPRLDPWWEVRAQVLNAWIHKVLPGTAHGFVLKTDLFDESSGPYHHAEIAGENGVLLGMDQSLAVVKASKARLEAQAIMASFIVCDVRAMPLRKESISTALSLSTLDHFEKKDEIHRSIIEIFRVMKPGGQLLLTLDNPYNITNILRSSLPQRVTIKLRADTFPIGVTLNRHEAEACFRKVGFEVRESTYLIHSFRYLMIRVLKVLQRAGYKNLLNLGKSSTRKFEMLQALPTRALSGHFSAWSLEKR